MSQIVWWQRRVITRGSFLLARRGRQEAARLAVHNSQRRSTRGCRREHFAVIGESLPRSVRLRLPDGYVPNPRLEPPVDRVRKRHPHEGVAQPLGADPPMVDRVIPGGRAHAGAPAPTTARPATRPGRPCTAPRPPTSCSPTGGRWVIWMWRAPGGRSCGSVVHASTRRGRRTPTGCCSSTARMRSTVRPSSCWTSPGNSRSSTTAANTTTTSRCTARPGSHPSRLCAPWATSIPGSSTTATATSTSGQPVWPRRGMVGLGRAPPRRDRRLPGRRLMGSLKPCAESRRTRRRAWCVRPPSHRVSVMSPPRRRNARRFRAGRGSPAGVRRPCRTPPGSTAFATTRVPRLDTAVRYRGPPHPTPTRAGPQGWSCRRWSARQWKPRPRTFVLIRPITSIPPTRTEHFARHHPCLKVASNEPPRPHAGPSRHRGIGPSGRQPTKPSDHRHTGPPSHRRDRRAHSRAGLNSPSHQASSQPYVSVWLRRVIDEMPRKALKETSVDP